MKTKPLTLLLILVLTLPLFITFSSPAKAATSSPPGLYVGVDVAYGSVPATEQLIDNISSYTNIFVLGCVGNYNLTRLTVLCQYLYDKDMSFIVFSNDDRYPSKQWLQNAPAQWGDKFVGIYYLDEEGGRQLDQQDYPPVTNAANYSDAAAQFDSVISYWLRGPHSITQSFDYPTQYPLFESDYGLYWNDYQAGYDTVFAEFGANYSRQVNVALCRGAAEAYGKDWGVMITWTYRQPPYIESGANLYNDMVLAYQNGAKYILIFDSNQDYSQNILQQDQLNAMQEFWQYAQDNPRTIIPVSSRTAYVLPEDWGYGFRGPDDTIWGLWRPDAVTSEICMNTSTLLQTYGMNLDIVYPDGPQSIQSEGYQNVFTWNNMPVTADNTTSSYHQPDNNRPAYISKQQPANRRFT